jgi:spoIIIJ-associated protein
MNNGFDTEAWIEEFLTELIELTGLDVSMDEMSLDDEDVLQVQLAGPDSARVIGRDGQMLDAFQHMVIAAAIHAGAGSQRILIDVEHYRNRREQRVCDEAVRMAEEALKSGEFRDLSPMSPRERRLVHLMVKKIEGVITESLGEGEERFVRIIPAPR